MLRAIIVLVILIIVTIVFAAVRVGVGGTSDPSFDPLPPRDEILDEPSR